MYLCKKAMTSIRTCRLSPSYNSRWICKFILNWPTICGHAQSVLLAPSHVCKEIVETHTKRKCVRSSPGRAWQRLYHPRHTSQIACRCGRNDQTGSSNRAANCLTIRWTQQTIGELQREVHSTLSVLVLELRRKNLLRTFRSSNFAPSGITRHLLAARRK